VLEVRVQWVQEHPQKVWFAENLGKNATKSCLTSKNGAQGVMKITVWNYASCAHTALIAFELHASDLYFVWVIFAFTAVLLTCLFFRFVCNLSSRFKFIKTLTTGLRCHSLHKVCKKHMKTFFGGHTKKRSK